MAMGCMGVSYDDFCRCTPSEFLEVAEQWRNTRDFEIQSQWNRARFLATAILQPYSNSEIKPTDIVRFPWDREEGGSQNNKNGIAHLGTSTPKLFEEIIKKRRK